MTYMSIAAAREVQQREAVPQLGVHLALSGADVGARWFGTEWLARQRRRRRRQEAAMAAVATTTAAVATTAAAATTTTMTQGRTTLMAAPGGQETRADDHCPRKLTKDRKMTTPMVELAVR